MKSDYAAITFLVKALVKRLRAQTDYATDYADYGFRKPAGQAITKPITADYAHPITFSTVPERDRET